MTENANTNPIPFQLSPLFWIGIVSLVVGCSPLLAMIVLAQLGLSKDPNPNPIGFGILAMVTFWPSLALIVAGLRSSSRRHRRAQAQLTSQSSLQNECRQYLENGPPAHMKNYVPESVTEILIAHGANGQPLDTEFMELGSLILLESEYVAENEDPEIRGYMQKGADLVRRVLEANA